MNALVVVLAVFGCSEVDGACMRVEAAQSAWPTMAACSARLDEALTASTDLDFPLIRAVCEPAGDERLVAEAAPADPDRSVN